MMRAQKCILSQSTVILVSIMIALDFRLSPDCFEALSALLLVISILLIAANGVSCITLCFENLVLMESLIFAISRI